MNLTERLLKSCIFVAPTDTGSILLRKKDHWWKAEIDDNIITYTWAKEGGLEQELEVEVEDGKNIGRANETTPHEQAIIEVRSKINKKIMDGYNVRSSFGVFVGMDFKVRTQCPSVMLAKKFEDHEHKLPKIVIIQPKLDGIRCLANTITGELFSRKKEPILSAPHVSEAILSMNLHDSLGVEWLDGELYNHDLEFQKICSIVRMSKSLHPEYKDIQYHVYDYISDEPESARKVNLSEVDDAEFVKIVEYVTCDKSEIDKAQVKFVKEGYEGTIIRDPRAGYQQKRSDKLLKLKDFIQEEFKILGVKKEEFEDTLGTFICRAKNGKTFDPRPSFTDELRLELWKKFKNKEMSGYVATVSYFRLTFDGIPYIPIVRGIRHIHDR